MGQYLITLALLLAALAFFTVGAISAAIAFGVAAVLFEFVFWLRVLIRRRSRHAPDLH